MPEYSSLIIRTKDNSKDCFVLQLRDNNPNIRFPGNYSLFGGEVKKGESAEQALKREIKEELDLDLENEDFQFYKTFNWKQEYVKILSELKQHYQGDFNRILHHPQEIFQREAEEIIDNLYILTLDKDKVDFLRAREGTEEIISFTYIIYLKMLPLDKLMLLYYLSNKAENNKTNKMRVPFVDLKKQYESIETKIKQELNWVLQNTSFILGEKVNNFEKDFALFCRREHAIAVNSGTSSLHLALLAKGIGQGDEVITVSNTFIATTEAISYTGAKPVLVDVGQDYLIDTNKIEQAITEKTKAIIPVHLYGQVCDMDKIIEIAEKHGLTIIEDCCQAHGAEYKGKRVPITDTGCFSFYPGKNLGAYGEGGILVTNNEEIAKKIQMLRDHGQEKKYYHKYIGYNCRMDGFQGAVLGVKLDYLPNWIEKRRENAHKYTELLRHIGEVITPIENPDSKHVYHLYVIRVKDREKLMDFLKSKEIDTGIHYLIPIHLQEAYSFLRQREGSHIYSEKYSKEILSLPMFPELTEEQIRHVADSIKEFYQQRI